MDTVNGKLEIATTQLMPAKVRILLDGDTGDILVGGQDCGGDIELKDHIGKVKIRLDAGGRDELQVTQQTECITLKGAESSIRVATSQGETLRLDAAKGNMWLGGNGVNGDLLLIPSGVGGDITRTSKAAIWLDAEERSIRIRSSDEKDTIQLIANRGKIVLGGNGKDGDLLVFAEGKHGKDLDNADNAAIWIRGSNGDILLANGDCAEDFDVSGLDEVEPGTVMVLDREGRLEQSTRAYDKKVAGVISGAGDHRPGIVLDRKRSQDRRHPVALLGKAYCKVDAQYAPIKVGDLLTTSPTPGHAMKASDPLAAFGAVIGKALRSLDAGSGLIPMLITLQ